MVVCVFPILGRSPEDLELFSLTLDLLFRIVCSTVGVRYSVDWTSLMNILTVDGLRLLFRLPIWTSWESRESGFSQKALLAKLFPHLEILLEVEVVFTIELLYKTILQLKVRREVQSTCAPLYTLVVLSSMREKIGRRFPAREVSFTTTSSSV